MLAGEEEAVLAGEEAVLAGEEEVLAGEEEVLAGEEEEVLVGSVQCPSCCFHQGRIPR